MTKLFLLLLELGGLGTPKNSQLWILEDRFAAVDERETTERKT